MSQHHQETAGDDSMHMEWWAVGDTRGTSPWQRIPREERAVDQDLMNSQMEDPCTVFGPSWRVGHTLYTVVHHNTAVGGHGLYALRPSGDLQRLLTDVSENIVYAAWLRLTSPPAPTEPWSQLVFEELVQLEFTSRSALDEPSDVTRRHHRSAHRIARWARARSLARESASPSAGEQPDLAEFLRRLAGREERQPLRRLEEGWATGFGTPHADPLVPSHGSGIDIEEWYDVPPPGGLTWDGRQRPAVNGEASFASAIPRPHRHRSQSDLMAQLRSALWSVWQADRKIAALTVDNWVAEAMRQAEVAAACRDDAERIAERHRQTAIQLEADASRWWIQLFQRSWPPTVRRRLRERATLEREIERSWRMEATRRTLNVQACLAAARRLVSHSADPAREWELTQTVLPQLLWAVSTDDCRSAPGHTRHLELDAKAADHLRTWHERALWHIEQELRARAHPDHVGARPHSPRES